MTITTKIITRNIDLVIKVLNRTKTENKKINSRQKKNNVYVCIQNIH